MAVACCISTNYPFVNVGTVSIPHTGDVPNVEVYYQQDGDYVLTDDVQVIITPTAINIDMGGPATGIVKVF